MMITEHNYARKGFTLAEIMVTITIIGIIMGLIGPGIYSALKKATIGSAKTMLKNIKTGITRYQMDLHQYPAKLIDLVRKPKGLDERLSKKGTWPYIGEEGIKEVPYDPWDAKYEYKLTPSSPKPYELWSWGPNGKNSPKDEQISVWEE